MNVQKTDCGVNIKFKEKDNIVWINDDIVKMAAWTHLNKHIENIPDIIGESVDVGNEEFSITDVQPVVGWALGTCFEVTARRKYPDDSGE